MQPQHFHRLAPVCPTCRATGRPAAPLELGRVIREAGGDIIEGVVLCPASACRREHPIIDGIPIIVADIRSYVSHQLGNIHGREDLSPSTESLLCDCVGPGTEFERNRYHLSAYARGHYGDLDPDDPAERDGSVVALLEQAVSLLAAPPSGLWLDAGCAVGRTTFELAARTGGPVVGVDLNFGMLRLARQVARTGEVRYPQRRVGIAYDRHSFAAAVPARAQVDFWACDAAALPLESQRIDGLVSLNLLDCMPSPLSHLAEIGRVLRPGAEAILATPYDWSPGATAIEAWIGGHSQRSDGGGSSARELRRLLSDEVPAQADPGLRLVAEREALPWRVYVHERASMLYQVHLCIARATEISATGQ